MERHACWTLDSVMHKLRLDVRCVKQCTAWSEHTHHDHTLSTVGSAKIPLWVGFHPLYHLEHWYARCGSNTSRARAMSGLSCCAHPLGLGMSDSTTQTETHQSTTYVAALRSPCHWRIAHIRLRGDGTRTDRLVHLSVPCLLLECQKCWNSTTRHNTGSSQTLLTAGSPLSPWLQHDKSWTTVNLSCATGCGSIKRM